MGPFRGAPVRDTLIAVFAAFCIAGLDAQGRPGQRGRGDESGVSPAEIQRMFDSYALMQAQEQLQIPDERFAQFLTRFKALQDVRRRTLQTHARLTQELRRLLAAAPPDEAQLKDRILALQNADEQGAADIRKAYDAIDQLLDVRQQAKFRVFEEMMERRKLELVTRARQSRRQQNQQ